jgi:hypothetical protein
MVEEIKGAGVLGFLVASLSTELSALSFGNQSGEVRRTIRS